MQQPEEWSRPLDDSSPGYVAAAFGLLFACLAIGGLAGWAIGASRTTTGETYFPVQWASMLEQPLENADKAFNWLLFCLFACTGIISACIVGTAGRASGR